MIQFKRFFSTAAVKNTYKYLDTQKTYEIVRTIVYFAVSASLFIAGYVATDSNVNLLTVVAVLGCLPASKSLVSAIMFCRFRSCSAEVYEAVCGYDEELAHLYDLVFTTEKKTYAVAHMAYKAKCLIFFSEKADVDANAFEAHIAEYLKRASISGVNAKLYTKMDKYCDRLAGLAALESEQDKLAGEVVQLMKEITL